MHSSLNAALPSHPFIHPSNLHQTAAAAFQTGCGQNIPSFSLRLVLLHFFHVPACLLSAVFPSLPFSSFTFLPPSFPLPSFCSHLLFFRLRLKCSVDSCWIQTTFSCFGSFVSRPWMRRSLCFLSTKAPEQKCLNGFSTVSLTAQLTTKADSRIVRLASSCWLHLIYHSVGRKGQRSKDQIRGLKYKMEPYFFGKDGGHVRSC